MKASTFPYVSEVRQESLAKGREEGLEKGREERFEHETRAVERVLDKRGIAMTAADRERILSCRDEATIDAWLDRMVTVETVAELFDSEPRH